MPVWGKNNEGSFIMPHVVFAYYDVAAFYRPAIMLRFLEEIHLYSGLGQ